MAGVGLQIRTTVPDAFDHGEHGLVGLHVMLQSLAAGEHADHALERSRQELAAARAEPSGT